ncbi:hypothetical protein BX070DRAFT_87973 [Coemansia spiralis]|nr:hypothetical protein BX070DRAFT_87973 [Coemansia spiralis]
MDHDSEVETILADDDWFNTPGEGAERRGGALGRRREIPNEESHINYNSSPFDEEELFSSSGSLSSLHEFSDSDDENDNNRMESSTNGATIRNSAGRSKSSNSVNNSNGSRLVVMSPAANTESEVDVDGDDLRGTTTPLYSSKKKPSIHEGSPSSLWQIHRRRKVIADDEDDNDSNSDNPNNLDADVEDSPSNKNNHKRQKVAQMLRRNLSPSSKSTNCAVDQSSREQESEHRDFVRKNQVDAALRRHRLTKRRKPRYDDPDYTDDSGCPQLVYFAAKDDCSVCRKLLLRGAAIDKADLHGLTAVHAASKHANLETLRLLLNPPARSHFHDDTETEDGSTILEDPESQFLRQLMSPFPNINSTTLHSHLTPLHQAVMSDNIDAVCLLLDNGANTSITNSRNLTPLEICSNEDIARLLTDRAKIQRAALVRDKAGQTKLHRACSAGDLGQTIKFICQGADINMKDNAGWTSLHEAALEGHNDVVVELLRRGADFAARGFGGDTPLHDACANGHVDVVRSLLAAGADIHIKNNKNITPEDMAEEGEQDEVIQIIEQHKRVKGKERIGPSVAREASKHLSKGKSKGKHPAVYPSASDNRALDISNDKANNTVEIEFDVVSNPSVPDQESSSKPNANGKHSGRQSPAFSKIQKVWRSESAQHRHSVEREIVNSDTTTSASQRRELMSLKRLCDEAEKPQVNYYFSSNSSKLSRDERKLQVLVGTIERMEKRKSKPQRRASLGSEANDTLSNEALDNFSIAGDMQTDRENTNENEKFADNTAYPHDTSSTSLSPKRRRGRPPKKRVINDDDDDDKDDGGLIVPGKTACHSPKRTKHISELLTAAESIVKTEHIQNGLEQERMQKQQQKRQCQPSRSSVITIDGSNKPSNNNKNPVRPSSLFDAATTVTPTVEIKSEPIFGQTVEHQPPQNVHKSRTAKPPRIEEGRTIVEDSAAQIQRAEALTQSSIAAQAIRYACS